MYLGIPTNLPNPIEELEKAFTSNGMLCPKEIVMDGVVHRFRANPTKTESNESGWYVFFADDGYINGAFGDWSTDVKVKFHNSAFESLTPYEREQRDKKIAESIEKATKEREQKQVEVAHQSTELWNSIQECNEHGYITRKGLKNGHGARLSADLLVVPLMDKEGQVWNVQRIAADGTKMFQKNGRVKGLYWVVGEGKPEYLCEGFATACSVYEATGKATVVGYNAGNLAEVGKIFPNVTIIADNDKSGTGEEKAKESKLNYILVPEEGCDANDYAVKYGIDALAEFLKPKKQFKVHSVTDWLVQGEPRTWLLKNWVLKGPALQMTFGASGGGKTFINIDRMLDIATHGFKVMYLCGEGIQSAQARVAVWVQEHEVDKDELSKNCLVVEEEFKLDTPEGIKLINDIVEAYQFKPDLVIVDTLIRFMDGDENDTKAANQFITYCNEIQNKYSCTLLLTHHTGLADNAQKRARGSSAFKGALDMQDMVTKTGERITVEQVKNKGGKQQEPMSFELEDHAIKNFYEDDGSNMYCAILKPLERVEEKETDKRAIQIVQLFVEGGYLFNGESRLSRDKAREIIRRQKIEETPQEPDEEDEAFEKRIGTNVRQALKRLFADNPYVEVCRSDSKGNPTEYMCKGINIDGVIEPDFTLSVLEKNKKA